MIVHTTTRVQSSPPRSRPLAGRPDHRRLQGGCLLRFLFAAIVGIIGFNLDTRGAGADQIFTPPPGTWNNHIIYLSQACHDGNDGFPGGPCIPNSGCDGMNENLQSAAATYHATFGWGNGSNLLERGYQSVVGTGTLNQNVASSNSVGADLHVPVHSNGVDPFNCAVELGGYGTKTFYYSANGRTCAEYLRQKVGAVSPGSSDSKHWTNGYGELTSTNAVACYLETEFHTWNTGAAFVSTSLNWTWRIGYAVDLYFGYP